MVLICNGPEIVLRCGSCCTEIHHNTSATTLGSLGRPRKPWARELAKTPEKSQVGTIAAQSVWPRLLTRMNPWMSSATIRQRRASVAGDARWQTDPEQPRMSSTGRFWTRQQTPGGSSCTRALQRCTTRGIATAYDCRARRPAIVRRRRSRTSCPALTSARSG
jgi:hypothetical protein